MKTIKDMILFMVILLLGSILIQFKEEPKTLLDGLTVQEASEKLEKNHFPKIAGQTEEEHVKCAKSLISQAFAADVP